MMSESIERDERHRARMQRKKALIDEKIAEAQDEYGLPVPVKRRFFAAFPKKSATT
jgi:hypothetical protein